MPLAINHKFCVQIVALHATSQSGINFQTDNIDLGQHPKCMIVCDI
jgi:hypothetical protein